MVIPALCQGSTQMSFRHTWLFFFKKKNFTYIHFLIWIFIPLFPPPLFFSKAVTTVHSFTKSHVAHTYFMKTKHKVMRRLRTFMTPTSFTQKYQNLSVALLIFHCQQRYHNQLRKHKQVLLNYTVEAINSGLPCLLLRNSSAVADIWISEHLEDSPALLTYRQPCVRSPPPNSRHDAVPLGHRVVSTPTALSQPHSIPSSKRTAVAMGRAADRHMIPDGVYASELSAKRLYCKEDATFRVASFLLS